ncbi:MAG: hypothetical protein Q9208_002750 [Pyrenodesmia sp. 3 TL-2023]
MPPLFLWLQLPSIREISLSTSYSNEAMDHDIPAWMSSGATISTLKHLHLHECNISNTDLTHILSACVSLCTIQYESVWTEEDYHEENDLPGLLKALWTTKSTLQNLTDWELHVNHEEQSTDTFELPKLEQSLPRSLQTIFFTHTQGRIGMLIGALVNLLRRKGDCVPRLQAISFEAHLDGNEHAPSLTELGNLAVANEVIFRAIDLPLDEDRCYYYDYEDLRIEDLELELLIGFWPGVTSTRYFDGYWKPGEDFICKPGRHEIQKGWDDTEFMDAEPL